MSPSCADIVHEYDLFSYWDGGYSVGDGVPLVGACEVSQETAGQLVHQVHISLMSGASPVNVSPTALGGAYRPPVCLHLGGLQLSQTGRLC